MSTNATATGPAWQAVGGLGYILKELHNRGDITDYGHRVLHDDLDKIRMAMTALETKERALLDVAEAAHAFEGAFRDLCEHYSEQDPIPQQIETWERASRTQCALADAYNALNDLLPQDHSE